MTERGRNDRMRMDRDDDGFGGGGVAFVGDAVDGDEDVGFGEVGGDTGAWDGVGDYGELWGLSCLAFMMAGDVYEVAFG